MASRQTAQAGQRQKPKRHASYPVIVPFNSLTRFFLQWHNMKSEETAPGNAFSQKISFFFLPSPTIHVMEVLGYSWIQTVRCNYPSGLHKERLHHQDSHWMETKTLILNILLDRMHASNILITFEPNYLYRH